MGEVAGLNWLRGFAALLVMTSHARKMFFVNYEDYAQSRSILVKVFYFITNLGTLSVMIFFVLSGYLVAGSAARSKMTGNWSWSRYMIARLSRLWTVLLPCLVLTFACDHIGLLQANPEFYDGRMAAFIDSAPKGPISLSLHTFWGNLFFLNGVFVSDYGSNGPLWSIACEFWYYILFPLALTISFSRRQAGKAIGNIALIIIISVSLGTEIMTLFPIWLIGYGAWLVRDHRSSRALRQNVYLAIGACAALCLGLLVVRAMPQLDGLFGKYLIGFLTALAIPALHHRIFTTGEKIAGWLSSLSFSLYLSHFPVLVLLSALLGNPRGKTIGSGSATFIIAICLCFAVSAVIYFSFERFTPSVRKAMLSAYRTLTNRVRTLRASSLL